MDSATRRTKRTLSIEDRGFGLNRPETGIRRADTGFTLLEILVAIFIFATVVTTLFGSFTSVFSSANAIDESMKSYEMAKNCLNRMTLDLLSIHVATPPQYAPPDLDDPPEAYRVVGALDAAGRKTFGRLRFTSLAHLPLENSTQKGVAEIVFYVQTTEEGDHVLRRADNLHPYEPFEVKASDPALCEGLESLAFEYYDEEGRSFDVWDSESDEFGNATPRAVGIKIELGDESASRSFETRVTLPIFRKKIR